MILFVALVFCTGIGIVTPTDRSHSLTSQIEMPALDL